jgi:hypothetical protein
MMDIGFVLAVAGYFVWPLLRDIRDTLIAMRIQNDPSFINVGWIKYRRLPDGSIETIETLGYKTYCSEKAFLKKKGRNLA